ncbi:MAG: hypothetical protein WCO51_13780 [bacterium]
MITENKDDSLRAFAVGGVIVFVLWCIAGLLSWYFIDDAAKRGQFGDSFGSINALFTGLAFAGVIVTIILQRRELSLQRQELELTRVELRRSAEAQELSNIELMRQSQIQYLSTKLAAITALVEMYSRKLASLRESGHGMSMTPNYKDAVKKLSKYQALLEQTFLIMEKESATDSGSTVAQAAGGDEPKEQG